MAIIQITMYWLHNQCLGLKARKYRYEPIDFPHASIKINIFFRSQESNHLLRQDSETVALRPLPSFASDRTSTTPTAVHVIARESLSYDDIQEAVGKPIRDHIQRHPRNYNYIKGGNEFVSKPAIELVWKKVPKALAKHIELKIDLHIRIVYTYMYVVSEDRHTTPRLVVVPDTKCCTICLAEIGGAATWTMACSHLFHAECFARWLKSVSNRWCKHPGTRRRIKSS